MSARWNTRHRCHPLDPANLIAEEACKPPGFLITVQGLLDILGDFQLVLIGAELPDLKAYLKKGVIRLRVALEVASIAVARNATHTVPALTLFGIAALILGLSIARYLERQAKPDPERTA